VISKCCKAEIYTSPLFNRCLRCGRDVEVTTSVPFSSFKEKDGNEVNGVGYMEEPLDNNLKNHFTTIVLMLAEGKVPEYEIVSQFEVNKFEDFLRKNRINYIKKSIFAKFREPSFLFSIPEEE
jgi:hypothetical protein